MLKKIFYSALGVGLLAIIVLGVLLAWPMYTLDPDQTIELMTIEGPAEARAHTGYKSRDDRLLPLRLYPAENSDIALILLHGVSGHGDYLHDLALNLSNRSAAVVFVPDLRGHGDSPERRGDIDYVEQLEDDLADLVAHVRKQMPQARIIVGGHSGGGGLAIRYAGGEQAEDVEGYMLLAPFLGVNAPTVKEDFGGWVHVHAPRLIALNLMNTVGIRFLDSLHVMHFNLPEKYRTDRSTTSYSWRMAQGYFPLYPEDLAAIDMPLLVVVGKNDDIFIADEYAPVVAEHASQGEVVIVPGNHFDLLLSDSPALETYVSWLNGF